jgi:hypothetical protein
VLVLVTRKLNKMLVLSRHDSACGGRLNRANGQRRDNTLSYKTNGQCNQEIQQFNQIIFFKGKKFEFQF